MKNLIISLKIILLSVIVITACSKMTEKKQEKESNYTLGSDEVIIEAGSNMEREFGKNYKAWTPSDADIEIADKQIARCFENMKMGTVNWLLNRKPDGYNKQFIGAINDKGEKIIWVNCFCKSEANSFKDWKTRVVMVKDGGNCFFNLKVNVDKNEYYDIFVNGDA
ncbi:MAG TPA: hypothetical protein VGK25_09750 [Ignavibacteria bacterium]|jgi:hypothetical protein